MLLNHSKNSIKSIGFKKFQKKDLYVTLFGLTQLPTITEKLLLINLLKIIIREGALSPLEVSMLEAF